MSVFTELEAANASYVASGTHREVAVRPERRLAVVTCMDSRIDVHAVLGLDLGDVHVIRTAGARVTDDVLRSLALSQHLLGTSGVAVIGHTSCGLHDHDGNFHGRLADALGDAAADHDWHAFSDPTAAVRTDCERLLTWPLRPTGLTVAGYLLDVTDGRLQPVFAATQASEPT